MKKDSIPEISSSSLDEDGRQTTETGLPVGSVIGTDLNDHDSADDKGITKEDKGPKLKKHPGAPKRFRT
jgi:hypothetical protein